MGDIVRMFVCKYCNAGPFPNSLALRLHKMNTHGKVQ